MTDVTSVAGPTANDACPTCGVRMAPDQRYCLSCGHRRGDPRLPFMDAVVFMDSVKRPGEAEPVIPPPPPSPGRSGFSPQSTLIAGVATLVLAVGVGVLIGRSGQSDAAPVANNQPQIIKVGGGGEEGGGEEETAATTAGKEAKGGKKAKGKEAKAKSAKKDKGAEEAPVPEEGDNGGSKASEEVLHTSEDAKPQAKATAEVGEGCEKGTAGCSESGEFDGSFFE